MVITKRALCRKKGRKYMEADCDIERVLLSSVQFCLPPILGFNMLVFDSIH